MPIRNVIPKPVLQALPFVVLGALPALVALGAYQYANRTLVVALPRTLSRPLPPWTYVPDWTRFLGLVVEPLCLPDEQSPFAGLQGLSDGSCIVEDARGTVWVPLRSETRWSPHQVKGALEIYKATCAGILEVLFDSIDEEAGGLRVHPTPGINPRLLAKDLMTTPVSLSGDIDGKPVPVGTGPYEIKNIWKSGDPGIPWETTALQYGDNPGHIGDVTVLAPRKWTSFGRLREIVFVGLNESTHPSPDLADAISSKEVNLAWAFTSPLASQVHAIPQDDWRSWEQPGVFSLIASLNARGNEDQATRPPDVPLVRRLSYPCESFLVAGLQFLSNDAPFLRELSATPLRQPLAATETPFQLQHVPLAAPSLPPGAQCDLWLLTNRRRADEINILADRFLSFVGGSQRAGVEKEPTRPSLEHPVVVHAIALDPKEQSTWEESRAYHAQVLSYFDQGDPPALFLFSNFSQVLKGVVIGPPDRRITLPDLLDLELRGQLTPEVFAPWLTAAESRLVALGAHNSYYAARDDVLGLREGGILLDPARLDLRRTGVTWYLGASLALFLLSVGVSTWLGARARSALAEQATTNRLVGFYHHQLSSPLTAAKARAARLLSVDAEKARRVMQDLDDALEIVDQTFWFFRKGILAETLVRASVDLAPILHDERRTLLDRARALGLADPDVRVEIEPDLPPVRLSQEAAHHLLSNLLENALKYRRDTALRVTIRAWRERDRVVLTVSDEGLGIDEKVNAKNLFKAGFRTDTARAHQVAGSGIGLTICYEILKAVDGSIQVTKFRDPTTFRLQIPLAPRPKGTRP